MGESYESIYIDQEGTEVKTNRAMKNVSKKTDALSKHEKRFKEIESQAEYKAYRFKRESEGFPVRTYWEWLEDKKEAKRARKEAINDFWFETPKGTFTVIGGAFVIAIGACAHAFHWLHIP